MTAFPGSVADRRTRGTGIDVTAISPHFSRIVCYSAVSSAGSSTYSQVRLRRPPGARPRLIRREERAVALTASPTLRDENP